MMDPEFMGDLVVGLGLIFLLLFVICLGGIIADYILPHISFIERMIDRLPDYEDEEDVIREYEESRRRRRERRAERRGAKR